MADLSLEIAEGEVLVLLGASGCGKTTMLKMINRLVPLTSGVICVDGRDVQTWDLLELRRSIGYVFQDIGLFPHMSVAQNVAIVPRLLGWTRSRRAARVRALLELVGLDPAEHARRRPHELSGGQQQRVGIARALACDPAHLLMDEPFGALDAVTRGQLQQQLLQIKRDLGKTVVFVTHDLFEAIRLGDRIAVMNAGRLQQVGPVRDLLEHPATPFVKDLFDQAARQINLLHPDG
ncbi:MAG: ATP-binding cassette domain-containing protein [Phycisphaerae bacterium]|nr:ATP-binding cassette domain-containing protein [Phycisphaerae bacterium]